MAARATERFFGRARELQTLAEMLDEALRGGGRLVTVAGDAGIGKTRLCEELAALARGEGVEVAWAACWDATAVPALWAPRQLFGQIGIDFEDSTGDLDDPGAARVEFFDEIGRALRSAARSRPLMLVVDDAQWADPSTLLLLVHLAPLVRSMAVLVVATVRDSVDTAPAVTDLLRRASRIRLTGLSSDDVRGLVEDFTDESPTARTVEALWRLTAGNPLFATELARRLRDEGGVDQLLRAETVALPSTVRAVLEVKLRELPAACTRLLHIAAVNGREVALELLASVASQPAGDVLTDIDAALAARVLEPYGVGRFAFTHPLLRAALLDELGFAARVRIHQLIGDALELADEPDVAALAFHHLHAAPAGSASKAIRYAARAADAAMAALAYEDSARLYEHALEVVELDKSTERIALLLGAAAAHAARGTVPAARLALVEAAALARRHGRAADLAAAALGMAGSGFEVVLFDDEQVALLEEALAVVGDDEPATRSRLSARLSVALSLTGQDDRRAVLADEAVDLAARSGDDRALAHALAARCDIHAGPADVARRLDDSGRIVAIATASRESAAELLGRRLRIVAAFEAGDFNLVDRDVRAFAQIAERLGQPRYLWYVSLWRAARLAMRGRLAQQSAVLAEAEELGRRASSRNVEILALAQRWFVWLETGEVETAAAQFEVMLPEAALAELGVQMVPTVALHRIVAGRPDEAVAVLDAAADDLRAASQDSEWLPMVVQVAEACSRLGGHDIATWAYDALSPFGDRYAVEGIGAYVHGPVHRHLGLLGVLLDRRDDATRHFEAALAALRRAGADLLVARTLLDRGSALTERDSLVAARKAYAALGVSRRVDDLDALLGPAPTSPYGLGNLFRREGDVWLVRFAGRTTQVRDSKGMRDLSQLLASPGRALAAVDLAEPTGLGSREGDLGETLDNRARAAYRARLVELEQELDAADAAVDLGRSERLTAERDALVEQLSSAYGLGGRARRTGSTAERARTTVTSRIRDTMRRLAATDPDLGRHLDRAVRTGTFCVYDPDPPTRWET